VPQPDEVAWSETVSGVSGRLLAELEPSLRFAVHLELRNHSMDPIAVIDQPQIRAQLRDSSGHPVGTVAMLVSGPACEPQWAVIPRDAYIGIRIDMRTVGLPAPEHGVALLALGGRAWDVGPGEYLLQATLTCSRQPDGPQNQWVGELELPPLVVAVARSILGPGV
jgi:hypothetical protein